MIHIVKRKGHKQEFDERKIYASVYAACLTVRISIREAEKNADKVSNKINNWIKNKQEVNSNEIFKQISEELMDIDKEAAFIYTTHRDLS